MVVIKRLLILFGIVPPLLSQNTTEPGTTEATPRLEPLSWETVSKIKEAVWQLYIENPEQDAHASVVRMAFHDCVGDACDGCVNFEVQDNVGLLEALELLEPVYSGLQLKGSISRADFWQLAAITGIEYGVEINNRRCSNKSSCETMTMPELTFAWGRKDCPTTPYGLIVEDLPQPEMSREDTFRWYQKNLGFDAEEVVALSGVHTLGKMDKDNTGHEGSFMVEEEGLFNNNYYRTLTNESLKFTNQAISPEDPVDKKFQFNVTNSDGENVANLINTDLAIAFDLDVDLLNGTKCQIHTDNNNFNISTIDSDAKVMACPKSDTYSLVLRFAEEPNAWAEAFSKVYLKLTKHGYGDELKDVA